MELFYEGQVRKKDTGRFIREFKVYKEDDTLIWELTQEKKALFDEKDFNALIEREWRAAYSHKTFYPVAGKEKLLFAHNHIIPCGNIGVSIDHKNMNGLDNRRSNFRLATRQQQMLNRSTTGKSGFRGVTKRAKDGAWRAEGRIDSEHFHVGYFQTAEEAACAWDDYMFEKFYHHNPLSGLIIEGVVGEPTHNFIHFNFPERLGL